ncbi:MAG: ATP-binding protein [Bdellovibrionota bacterium]
MAATFLTIDVVSTVPGFPSSYYSLFLLLALWMKAPKKNLFPIATGSSVCILLGLLTTDHDSLMMSEWIRRSISLTTVWISYFLISIYLYQQEMMHMLNQKKERERLQFEIDDLTRSNRAFLNLAEDMASEIEQRKKMQEKLLRSKEELELANKELDRFASVASHDLQEPIRHIMILSDMLVEEMQDGISQEQREDLKMIHEYSQKMKQLVTDLLTFSKYKKPYALYSETSLNHCVKSAMDVLKLKIKETQAKIVVQDLPIVNCDQRMVTQLFQNLIANALKFVDQKPPQIHIFIKQEKNMNVFHVQDNGIGIRKEDQEKIFGTFKRLHQEKEYEGTGIGLSICEKAVRLHGGKIWVESDGPSRGTTIKFTLPNAFLPIPEADTIREDLHA